MAADKFSLYFSHSWKPEDVALNQCLWKALYPGCHLLVDANAGAQPPYFVNRIEEYVRRCDLFFAVLTLRPQAAPPPYCSKASLFEMRLAERARKPRFVLYERGTQFEPPDERSDFVRYVMFERNGLLDGRDNVDDDIARWLKAVGDSMKPHRVNPTEASLALLPQSADDVLPAVKRALLEGNYTRMHTVAPQETDFEVMAKLRSSGLLVADVTVTDHLEVLAMAHALFVPTIRIARLAPGDTPPPLPWYLRGHPAMGYDQDVVYYHDAQSLEQPLRERAAAMIDARHAIRDFDEGRRFFARRQWRPHKVFVSHSLKGEGRALVERLLALARAEAIDIWEYRRDGVAGADWREQLAKELAGATHAVVLVDGSFDRSDACVAELETLCAPQRKDKVELLPFLVGGWEGRAVLLNREHHQSLPADPEAAATAVLARLGTALRS